MTVATVFYISVQIAKIPSQSTQPSQGRKRLVRHWGDLEYVQARI